MQLSRISIRVAICLAAFSGGFAATVSAQSAAAAVPVPPQQMICSVVTAGMVLPAEARETSGLARSRIHGERFWTHNDAGNAPEIFALDTTGRLLARVRVTGAELVDWEDMAAAACPGGSCLFIGDIGDNDGERDDIVIYRVAEPGDTDAQTAPADVLRARFPDGPRDAEALFTDAAGNLYIVNKGRSEDIALYRYSAPARPGVAVMLERVRVLFPQPTDELDRVTAAAATPDGRWIGVRTYRTLYLYPASALLSGDGAAQPIVADLSALEETQGEALVIGDDGEVWVSSEAESSGASPLLSRLHCTLPR